MGNNVTISMGAMLISRSYDTQSWIKQCKRKESDKIHISRPIYLNDHTWTCAGAIILPGVRISGKGVIVGAGTVLGNDIEESYVLVAGSPPEDPEAIYLTKIFFLNIFRNT